MASPNDNKKFGNPNGRPPIVKDFSEFIREKLAEPASKDGKHTKLEAITAILLEKASDGDPKAIELCMAYGLLEAPRAN